MAKSLKTVLEKSKKVEAVTCSYIDDILINESQVTAEELMQHLGELGLITKLPELLDRGTAQGLKMKKEQNRGVDIL